MSRIVRFGTWLPLLLLLSLGALVWIGGREATLQYLVQKIAAASGGTVSVSGVRGSLYGNMYLAHVSYRSTGENIAADQVEIAWSPWQLLSGGVAIERLHADALTVESLTVSAPPPALPQTLALPLPVTIRSASIDKIALVTPAGRDVLTQLRLTLSGDARQLRLRDASVVTPWGQLSAAATVGANRPFAVDGRIGLTPTPTPTQAQTQTADRLDATIGGTLNALSVAAQAAGHGASAQAELRLAPFDAAWLHTATIKAQRINPASFSDDWPQADLTLDLDLRIGPDRALKGTVDVRNAMAPGSLDRQRLPLRSASAQFGGSLDALQIGAMLIDLGAAGKFTGDGNLSRGSGNGSGNSAAAEFVLHTDRIDLQAIHGRMKRTHIAGDIVLGHAGAAQTLRATLGQDRLRLQLDAQLADGRLQLRQASLRAGASDLSLSGQADVAAAQNFTFSGALQRFNPADFGAYPAADINADLRLDGHLAPAWQLAANVALRPSRLFQQPLSGKGSVMVDAQRVSQVDLALKLGSNLALARGSFGSAGDRLDWRIDAAQLDGLRANLAGALNASGSLSGTMANPRLRLDARARGLRWQSAAGRQAAARAGADSVLQLSGELALRGAGPFRLKGDASRFDPAAFGAYPSGSINGAFEADGRLGSDWRVALDLKLKPSTLLAGALSGRVALVADATRISNADVDLRLADNQLLVHGAFGSPRDRLEWRVQAPQLRALGPDFGGSMNGSGVLAGTVVPAVNLQAEFKLDGQQLRAFDQYQLASLHANGQLGAGADGVLQLDAELAELVAPAFKLQALRLQAGGSRSAHTIKAAVRNDRIDLQAEAAGGWSDGLSEHHGWSGSIRALQNGGAYPLTLQAPAPFSWHGNRLSLTDAQFKLASGNIALKSLVSSEDGWHTQGQAAGVPLNYLAQLSKPLRDNLDASLTLGASWVLDVETKGGPSVDGSLRVFRERGDVTLGPAMAFPLVLGMKNLELRADIVKNALRAQFDLDGTRVGQAHFDASSQLTRRDGKWQLAGDAPLQLNGSANMASLAWLAPLAGQPGLELDGKLALSLAGSGTVAAPKLTGELRGEQLALRWIDQGLKLRNGSLLAQLNGDQLQLQTLRFDGEQGSARADGFMRFADAEVSMQIKLIADRLQVLSRPDRLLVVSGQSNLALNRKRLQLDGKFKAERAMIELQAQDAPVISDDVVVLGPTGRPGLGARSAAGARPQTGFPLDVDIEADLGDRFYLKGQGLDAQLAGTVRIRSTDKRLPRATGSIRVVEGTYAAYGQKLAIERGIINFSGALDNPGINILAVRKIADPDNGVEAGVEVRGTALAPKAKLVSTPVVQDSEKLSWLVLGHGSEGVAGQEREVLAAAAGALFGGGQSRLAGSLGLDELGMARVQGKGQAQALESTVLTLGKRISSRAYLSYEQGVSGATSLVKLRYMLSKGFSLQAQTGTASALDLFYTWSFD